MTIELSLVAEDMLARRKRIKVPPAQRAQELLDSCMHFAITRGYATDFDAQVLDRWVEFHRRFGGIVFFEGLDSCVLGVCHLDGMWVKADQIVWLKEKSAVIACADCHPSYNYFIEGDGTFWGDPASSFELAIERVAYLEDIGMHGAREMPADWIRKNITEPMSEEERIEYLCDEYFSYFRRDNLVIRFECGTERISGWRF